MLKAIVAIRQAMRLTEDISQVGESLKAVAHELRNHDGCITRLEAKWETMMELVSMRAMRKLYLEKED